jgi:tetratricopeptide (TPR) repeat protein/DNA-binding CsgD family transcriptional regulator
MQTQNHYIPQDIYDKYLKSIKGISFTRREIDILSFFVRGRSTKRIATSLSISPKTIEFHTRNIMQKLGCNSKEKVIDFMEESEVLPLIRKYHTSSLINEAFEISLINIHKLTHNARQRSCKIRLKDDDLMVLLSKNLSHHLKVCGTRIKINWSNETPTKDTYRSAIIIPKGSFLSNDEICLDGKNYYSAVFLILEKIIPIDQIKQISTEFNSTYDKLIQDQDSVQINIDSKNIKLPSSRGFQKKWNKIHSIWISILVTMTILFGMFYLKTDNFNKHNSFKKASISSELAIPSESTLLHRPFIMSQITKALQHGRNLQTIVLAGGGGYRKTTLARQFASNQQTDLIWEINSETQESVLESFEELSQALAISDKDKKTLDKITEIKDPIERQSGIINFVHEKLITRYSWVLLFDNVDNLKLIQSYIPHKISTPHKGIVLITTRFKDLNLKNGNPHTIYINELDSKDKLSLFLKIMNSDNGRNDFYKSTSQTEEFLKQIPPYPLDVSLAAYYLKATSTSYIDYLHQLEKYPKEFLDLEKDVFRSKNDYQKTRYSIITLSLSEILKAHKDFKELLLLICLLNSQNIIKQMLDSHKGVVVADNLMFHLKKYDLIKDSHMSRFQSLPTFSIHRSTQNISLAYLKEILNLKENRQLTEPIIASVIDYLNMAIDKEEFLKLPILLGHCEAILSHEDILDNVSKNLIYCELGCIYFYIGNKGKSRRFLDLGYNEIIKINEVQQVRFIKVLSHMGQVYRRFGDYEKATVLLNMSLKTIQKHSPHNHKEIAQILTYLGIVYRDQGNYISARKLLENSLHIFQNQFPEDKINHAWVETYLGTVYKELGLLNEAQKLLEGSIFVYQSQFSDTNPDLIAWAKVYLGDVYREQGNYKNAHLQLQDGLNIYKQCVAKDHYDIGWTMSYTGRLYADMREYQKAKQILEESLIIYLKHFPDDHYEVAYTMNHLGRVCGILGDYQRALSLTNKSLRITRKHFGEDHFETARVLINLGKIYLKMGNIEEAQKLFYTSLNIYEHNPQSDMYLIFESLADSFLKIADRVKKNANTKQYDNARCHALEFLQKAIESLRALQDPYSIHHSRILSKLNNLRSNKTL